MKTTTLKTLFGSVAIAGALLAAPVATYAADVQATSDTSVRINRDGIVSVLGAEVTSVSGNIVNAVTRFKNNVVSWAFTTNASTTIASNGSLSGSIADLKVGDTLHVAGTLTGLGSPMNIAATKIIDVTAFAPITWKSKSGTIQSVNTANGTFVLKHNDKLYTVQTNASTTIQNGTTATTLGNVAVGTKVAVSGTLNSNGTVITASKVAVVTNVKHWMRDWKKQIEAEKKEIKEANKDRKEALIELRKDLNVGFGLHFGDR